MREPPAPGGMYDFLFDTTTRGKGRPAHGSRTLNERGRLLNTTSVKAAFEVHLHVARSTSKRGAYMEAVRHVADLMKLHPDQVKTYARRHRTLVAMNVRVRVFSDQLTPIIEEIDRLSLGLDSADLAALGALPPRVALDRLRELRKR